MILNSFLNIYGIIYIYNFYLLVGNNEANLRLLYMNISPNDLISL